MNPGEELFRSNLALIDRVIRRVCARGRLYGADAEDFASEIRLALMANEYAILRSWEERSSLATFLTIAIQRLFINSRVRESGKWHPSSEALRMGAAAVELERIVRREGRSLEEALPIVQAIDASLTRDQVAAMAGRLPERAPRARAADVDPDMLAGGESADRRAVESEARRVSDLASDVVRRTMASMPLQDRMILRSRFGKGMTVADVARMMQIEQRPLYRRIEASLGTLRKALTEAGADAATIAELIGSPFQSMNFGLTEMENAGDRLSNGVEGNATRGSA
ncbi:MAG TPA: sigma-70 family RNA polymerase sigma factor [Thermoanaerobaculia bacterium]|nr:sigma-70 family RNA polymerase sigma factor [Thermoanaerobaculia bacterium]